MAAVTAPAPALVQHWGTVVLPVGAIAGLPAPVLAATLACPSDREHGGSSGDPLRILMVEDDVALATMYATRLRRDGHQVTTVHDGESGLREAVETHYDLVFLDINLPRLDGISLLQRLRQHETAAGRPVVILSNYSEPPLKARSEELGVRTYLVKSEVSPSQIAASVRNWAAN